MLGVVGGSHSLGCEELRLQLVSAVEVELAGHDPGFVGGPAVLPFAFGFFDESLLEDQEAVL